MWKKSKSQIVFSPLLILIRKTMKTNSPRTDNWSNLLLRKYVILFSGRTTRFLSQLTYYTYIWYVIYICYTYIYIWYGMTYYTYIQYTVYILYTCTCLYLHTIDVICISAALQNACTLFHLLVDLLCSPNLFSEVAFFPRSVCHMSLVIMLLSLF